MDERKKNTGTLSRNKRKEKHTHPDHKGSCVIHGLSFWISAYINTDKVSGEKYFRLYFDEKKAAGAAEDRPVENGETW
jgi:hypothetical protein